MSTLNLQMLNSQAVEDLVRILRTEKTDKVKEAIENYLAARTGGCPTPGCPHKLAPSYLCLGYHTIHFAVEVVNEQPFAGKTWSRPLVQEFFCDLFSKTHDQRKEICIYCAATDFSRRSAFNGLFCHGCGFYIDFSSRTLGYSEEWTTRSNIVLGIHVPGKPESCTGCNSGQVTAKLGDYYFCSTDCMRNWYHSQGKREMTQDYNV